MIALFTVMSFVIGCVDRMGQSFLSESVLFFFFNHSFWPFLYGLSLPVGDRFFQSDD